MTTDFDKVTISSDFLESLATELGRRVTKLHPEDREMVRELASYLLHEDPEEAKAAARTIVEILSEEPITLEIMDLTPNPNALSNWRQFIQKKIRDERIKAGLTQEELAEKAGLPQSHISRLENGKHTPSGFTVDKIAQALGIPIGTLDPSRSD